MEAGQMEAGQPVCGPEDIAPPRGPSLSDIGLDNFAPYLMNRAMGRWNAGLQAVLREHGLTTPQMRALAVLCVRPGITILELSVYTVIEQSTLSRTLDAMEARGLIRRTRSSSDARAREVYLTTAGRTAFARFWPAMLAGYERMLAGVSPEERAVFVTVLQKILRNIRRHPL
ncbi:MAG: MarR family transcriptional regulator [Roseovarius sp.]